MDVLSYIAYNPEKVFATDWISYLYLWDCKTCSYCV